MADVGIWKGGRVVAHAIVDERFAHLGDERWYLHSGGYAYKTAGPRSNRYVRYLHREVMGNPAGLVDHRNGKPLDCRRRNLRVTDKAGNGQNRKGARVDSSSGVRGVFPLPSGRFYARVTHRKKIHNLGSFDTLKQADKAVRAKRRELGTLTGAAV